MGANKEQLQAIQSNSDRILCLAGAGAGKTKTMIERISRLTKEGVAPSSILALTFTNAAAAEMRERYEKNNMGMEIPEFRTFHAFCYSIICKDPAIRDAMGYTSIPMICSDEQEKAVEEKAKTQCKITLSADKLKFRKNLNKKEQYQVELYDKAVDRLMRSENIITFDRLNSGVAELFANNHPATQPYKDKYKHIFVDECLPECMSVLTIDGWYSIRRLYDDYIEGKVLPLVKSYNIEKSEYEYKSIIGALKSENREIYEVHTEGLNKIQCTANHKIYTQRGYVEAKDLVIGNDMVILDSPDKQKTKYLLNDDQYQICLGSYLGDGHLDRMSKFYTYRLQITQGIKQQDYFKAKISAFSLKYHVSKSGYTREASVLSSNSTPVFALKNDVFNCVLSDISPLGLAIWYQDDGSLSYGKYPVINAGSFSFEQTQQLTSMLESRFDITATPHIDSRGYSYIRFNAENSIKFLRLISPFMHPSMQYKTTIDISNNKNDYNFNYLNTGANFISDIKYIGTDTVYDLTIADNHNFIVSKSAHRVDHKTGTIVHNCQDTDAIQMKFLNAFPNSNFFLCGDTLQNLYSFRGTSNEYIKALSNAEGWEKIRLFTNYRSTNQICAYTNEFSEGYADPSYRIEMKGVRDGDRVITKMISGPSKFSPIDIKDVDDVLKELKDLQGTSAILCRTNKEVQAITAYLSDLEVPYTSGKNSRAKALIDCTLSDTYMQGYLASNLSSARYGEYIRLSTQSNNTGINWFLNTYGNIPQIREDIKVIEELKRIAFNLESTNTKLLAVEKLLRVSGLPQSEAERSGSAFLQYVKEVIDKAKPEGIYVGTIHSVKGLEYDNVFVMNVGSFNFRLINEDMKNLFYVAVTRAKNRL